MRPIILPWVLSLTLLACSGSTSDELSEELGSDAGIDSGSAQVDDDAGANEPDAAIVMDAGELDAGELDAGLLDAGELDAGELDAGELDAGLLDAGELDAGLLDAGELDAGAGITTVIDLDFEGELSSSVEPGTGLLTPSEGFALLGTPGNTFGPTFLRSTTANTVTVTISSLPAHTSIDIDFLFAAIDSLDGEGSFPSGDYFRIDLDGVTVFRETFANAVEGQIQTYDPPAGVTLARRVDLGFGGPGGYYTDSAYDMSQDPQFDNLPHSAPRAVLTFTLEGSGVQALSDESWAIDNLRVRVGNTPRETPDAGVDAGVGVQ